MTSTLAPPQPAPSGPRKAPARRRWHRFAIPLGVLALFWAVTFGAHYYQQPRFGDAGTLSPEGTGRHGSSLLAQRLQAQGITIIRAASTDAALAAAQDVDATIFVPAPDLLDGRLLPALIGKPGLHRVVVVRPGLFGRIFFAVPFDVSQRWATATVDPDCDEPYAAAGPAAVARDRYDGDAADFGLLPGARCYGGSVVEYRARDVQVTLVGATDPFRNDRFAEAGNAALATGLLGTQPTLIWLDVHHRELKAEIPPLELPGYNRDDQDRSGGGDPLLQAFPPVLWAGLVLALGAGLLFAIARARRLGPPVPEPLPVLVPAAEAVLGRGRLYRRIRARAASLQTLRAAAIARLARTLDPLTPSPERALTVAGEARDAFVRAVAARAGTTEAAVSAILFGPDPEDDPALVRAAAELDQLVAAMTRQSGGNP